MKKLNEYFFGEEQIHPSDGCWFYGSFAVWTIIVGFVLLSVY